MQHNLDRQLPRRLWKNGVFRTVTVLSFVCLFLLTACGGPATPQQTGSQAKRGGTLRVGLIAEPTVLDPLTSVTLYDNDIMANMYDALFRLDAKNQLQGELVSSYSYKSPTLLDLKLHAGVTFQDGTPLNADAVIFNLNRFINDKTSPRYTDVSDITKLVKINDTELQVHLQKPFAPFLLALTGGAGYVLSPTAVQRLGKTLGQAPVGVGSGPFSFVEWIKGDHLSLKANSHYWRKDDNGSQLPYLAGIRFQPITSGSVMYTNLETGQVNVATGVDPNDISLIKSNPSLTYKQVPGPGFGSLFLDLSQAPMNNVHVRRAIAWAINRQDIVNHVLHGLGVISKGPISPVVGWAYDPNIQTYSYDPAKARAEIAQSGLSNISFTLLTQSGSPVALEQAQFIQSNLKDVGINMDIKQETFTAEITDVQTYRYQAAAVGWTGSIDADGDMFLLFTSTGGFNYTKYANPQVDTLLNEGRSTLDQSKRATIYRQAQQLIVQDEPFIFLDHGAVYQATTSNVKNYFLSPGSTLFFSSVWLSS